VGGQLSAYIAAEKRSVKKVLPSPFGLSVTHIRHGVPFHKVAGSARSSPEYLATCSQSLFLGGGNVAQLDTSVVKQSLAVFQVKIIVCHERAPLPEG
jgi:hypothetical protein